MSVNDSLALMLGGSLVALAVLGIILYVIYVIANWKIFTKAGEAGWKAIIPFLNWYVSFKIAWKKSIFWIVLILNIVAAALQTAGQTSDNMALNVIATILYIVLIIITIIYCVKMSKAFGHGAGFAIGLIFLNFIFTLILGLGSSQYVGPEGKAENRA